MVSIPFIPESPRWLLNNGDYETVKSQLMRMAKWNNSDTNMLTNGQLIELNAVNLEKKGSVKTMFIPQHIKSSILIIITMFCVTAAYFGVCIFQLTYLQSTDKSINASLWQLFLTSLAEIPAMIVGVLVVDHIPRRALMVITFTISCICFMVVTFNVSDGVCITLIFIGRMCLTIAYWVLTIYILEYYPTTIRATSLGVNVTLARFAGIAATFIGQDAPTMYASIIFSICCGISIVSSYLLPVETLGRSLKDDSDEGVEEFVYAALAEYDQSRPCSPKQSVLTETDTVFTLSSEIDYL